MAGIPSLNLGGDAKLEEKAMDLEHKIETYMRIEYQQLQRFIAEKYRLKEFCCTLESGNDSLYEYTVKKKEQDEWEKDDVKTCIASKACSPWMLGYILTDLCNQDLIVEGDYLLSVSW